jgi:NAD(P)-dependent dehydrogenase (short-subunit alcohol dehydrogenase family)
MKSAQNTSTSPCKVAIVTGAPSGIGLEMVKRLIEKGYRVVANSRKITSAITLHGNPDLKLVDGDIGVEETAKHVVSTAIQSFGAVDLLVNNAGVFLPKPFPLPARSRDHRSTLLICAQQIGGLSSGLMITFHESTS